MLQWGIQQGSPYMRPTLFCLALRPELTRFREDIEGEGEEAVRCVDDISLHGLWGSRSSRLEL